MASAAEHLLRADALLSDELARLHAARSTMTPVAKSTVCTALRSLAQDPDLAPEIAAEVRRVLDALLERPVLSQPRRLVGIRGARLRAA